MHTVLYFHELKFSTKIGFRLQFSAKFGFSRVSRFFVFQLSAKFGFFTQFYGSKLSLNCNFPRIVFEVFQYKIWFSFQFSRKTFRLQFSENMMRKNIKKNICVSSENILCATFRRLHNWLSKSTSYYKYKQNFKLNNCAIAKNPQAQPLMQTAVKCSIQFSRTEKNQYNVYPQRLVFGFQMSLKIGFSRKVFSTQNFSATFGFGLPLSRKIFGYNCH